MPRRNEPILAIDIGTTAVRACIGRLNPDGLVVERLIDAPLPPNSVREGLILEPDMVARALRTLLQQVGVRQRNALVSVGGPQVTARPVRLPPMTPEVLRKSIQYEAARYLPSAAEEHLIGFEILHSSEDYLEVLLVTAPRSTVDSVVNTLESAGLEAELLEIQPFACLRAVHASWQESMPPLFALADVGGGHTQISVVRQGTLALTRYIPIAGETLTAALKGYFHYSDEEVSQIKRALNLEELLQTGAPHENPPLRLVQPILDELIREIRRSLNYYQSQAQASPAQGGRIDQLILTGGGALMRGIAPYFEHRLGIRVQVFNPLPFDEPLSAALMPQPDEVVDLHEVAPVSPARQATAARSLVQVPSVPPEQCAQGAQWVVAIGTALAPLEQRMPFCLTEDQPELQAA